MLAISVPPNLTYEEVQGYLQSAHAQGVAFELLMATLADASSRSIESIKDRMATETSAFFPTITPAARSQVIGDIFRVLQEECKYIVSRLSEEHAEIVSSLKADAQFQRMTSIMELIERRLSNPRPEVSADQQQSFATRYLAQVRVAHGFLEPPDFDRRKKVPISSLYVEPTIALRGNEQQLASLAGLRGSLDRTVLVGDPGGGKSTAATVIMHQTATSTTAMIPFLVVLREFASGSVLKESVVEHIERRLKVAYQCPPPPGVVEMLLESGQALVIFDGLDELLDTSRRREITDVVSLFCSRYPLTRVLVTSRDVGYDQAPMDPEQFTAFQLADFSPNQVEEYVTKWFSQDSGLTEEEVASWTRSFMSESEQVSDLRSNALLLALMCIIYRGENSIPRNRPAVYERCATMLFEKWDSSRKIHKELRVGQLVDPAMKYLAYWMLITPDAQEGAREEVLVREATNYLRTHRFEDAHEAEVAAREFIEFCRGRAWVFNDAGSTADGEPLYKFTHRTFMEYFAAYHLTRISDTPEKLARRLLPRVTKAEWDVIAQLAVQIMDKHNEGGGTRAFRYLLNDRARRSTLTRENLLSFMCRCLEFLVIPPNVLRALVDQVVENTVSLRNVTDRRRQVGLSLGYLIAKNTPQQRATVRSQLKAKFELLASDEDLDLRKFGLTLASDCWLGATGLPNAAFPRVHRDDWTSYSGAVFDELYEKSDAEVRKDPLVRRRAFARGLISFEEAVDNESDVSILFDGSGNGVLSSFTEPLALTLLLHALFGDDWVLHIVDVDALLTDIANYLRSRNFSVEASFNEATGRFLLDIASYTPASTSGSTASPLEGDSNGIASFLMLCVLAESAIQSALTQNRSHTDHEAWSLPNLGRAESFRYYWELRRHGKSENLPVTEPPTLPEEIRSFLSAWAGGKSFIRENGTTEQLTT
ncbi:NACHT domain-containing protein [Micromonospora sp. NPDC049580]|uniref:NACHT domain-containing protein n=1 Tax=Micromonospora sp. NPDC049580 TaxID=3154832 RepID=UPI00343A49C6